MYNNNKFSAIVKPRRSVTEGIYISDIVNTAKDLCIANNKKYYSYLTSVSTDYGTEIIVNVSKCEDKGFST